MTNLEGFKLLVVLDEQRENNSQWAILHQCLLMLFDSPLNHAGYLEVYIRLADSRLIRMHREVRVPRTFKRFEQLFNNFLLGCDMPIVQTKDGHARLLEFAGKSIDKQLNNQYTKFRISNLAPKLKKADHFAEPLIDNSNFNEKKKIALFVDFGPVNFNILGEGRETEYEIKTINKHPDEDTYSISRYPLSPSMTCVKLTTAFEKALEVF